MSKIVARFLQINDIHLRASSRIRKDTDLLETILGKLEFALAYAQENDVDAILSPGDLLNTPGQVPRVRNKFERLVREYDIPWIVCIGNHDIPTNVRLHMYKDESDLGSFENNEIIKVLMEGNVHYVNGVAIRGFGIDEQETKDLLDGLWRRPKKDKNVFTIALVHAQIGGSIERMGASRYIGNSKIAGCDLNLIGDIHDDPFLNFSHADSSISNNPGALLRSTKTERNRQVGFTDIRIVEGNDGLQAKLKFVKIPMVGAEDAFDVARIEKKNAEKAQQIHASMAALSEEELKETEEQMYRRVGKEAKFKKRAIEIAVAHSRKKDGL